MKKNNLTEITILRSFAMLFVIGIHFLNLPQLNLTRGSLGQGFYFLWRAMLIFAVPCFMFLSMMMVSYTHNEKEFSAPVFYKKRLIRIGIPYLIWSIVYILLNVAVKKYTLADLTEKSNWIFWLSYGKAYDHLYFMAIMVQFYLFMPFLYPLAKKVSNSFLSCLFIAFLPQLAVYWINRLYIYEHYKMLSSSAAWYWCVAFLGLWFGFEYPKKKEWIKKHISSILCLNIISLIVHLYYQCLLWHQLWENLSFDTFPYTINLYLYILLSISTWLWLSVKFEQHWQNGQRKKVFDLLCGLSRYSYGIYLMHPIFMIFLRKILTTANAFLWFPITCICVPLLAIFCGILTKYGEKIPIIRYAFGIIR